MPNKAGRKFFVVNCTMGLILICLALGGFLAYKEKDVTWLAIPLGALCTAPVGYIGANAYIAKEKEKNKSV